MELLIKNAKLVDEASELDADILVRNGKIAAVGQGLDCAGEVIDAAGLTLMPAFVDLHCHFRDPGFTRKRGYGNRMPGGGQRRLYRGEPDGQYQSGVQRYGNSPLYTQKSGSDGLG